MMFSSLWPSWLTGNFIPLLIAILVLALTTRLLQNKRALPPMPGPALAAYTDLWRVLQVASGQFHITNVNLHKRHGPAVRTGPRNVSLADPALIPLIYGTKTILRKSGFYPLQSITWQKQPEMNIFSTQDVEQHRREKKRMAPAFTIASLLQNEVAIDSAIALFLSRLQEESRKQDLIDISHWMNFFALDAISEITFGKKLGFLDKGADVGGWIAETQAMLAYFAVCGQVPFMHKILLGNAVLRWFMRPMETWAAPLLFTIKRLDEFKFEENSGDVPPHFMSRWASIAHDESPVKDKMDRKALVINLVSNLFAGGDTTAAALTAIVHFLCRHPGAMERCVREIDDADTAGGLSNMIRYQETKRLPYLNALVKESMRLHPSVGLPLEREVPAGGLEVHGCMLPGGTIVGINPWVMGRIPAIFPDPDAFKPERWLDSDAEHLARMEEMFEFNFGAGSTKCLGRNISLVEIHKLIPQLLRNFKIELAEPRKDWRVNSYWFVFAAGLNCRVTERKDGAAG